MVFVMNLTPFHGPPATAPQVPGFAAQTLLGFGAHGEVWLAEDRSTGALVALKVGRRATLEAVVPSGIPPDRAGAAPVDPAAAAAAVDRETALLCRIEHPHIVRLQRVVELEGSGGLALVLDWAAGGSLASLVAARGSFDPGEVTTLLIPLAGALDHLHRRGLVHGDIAPGNVLFTADGRPQLGDLGAARMLGIRDGGAWATPGFADPALTGGGRPADWRAADLWGLAAVGWFALTGHPPAPERPTRSGERRRAPALVDLLERCLAPDPTARPGLDELADQAWSAARPVPVRLVSDRDPIGGEAGLPPLSSRVTRPVREPVREPGPATGRGEPGTRRPAVRAGQPPTSRSGGRGTPDHRRRPAGRFRGTVQRHRSALTIGAAITVGVIAVGGAVAVALDVGVVQVMRGPSALGPAPGGFPGSGSGVPATGSWVSESGQEPNAGPSSVPSTGPSTGSSRTSRQAELAKALAGIARSRAGAFASASVSALARADELGSPAYRADLQLVHRLQARSCRLRGVSYTLARVHLVREKGRTAEVSAMVTTSAHRQVATNSRTSVEVPPDGPRSLTFTLVSVGSDDASDWRVRSIGAGS
jgi:hypothetical protein